ncbi:hypothetical protein BJ508DRAFT_301805 [Ascobolus immersus RN42]|uniref:Uncharacterized protein n=1 Tax=Ascobolus immersus RN42 TaxID=1160509 RepID=A0A3N4IKN3_ASCIM|nr:hypothetical protein BJ508DRAFT_301805 [Ascobolus immersus RN42]
MSAISTIQIPCTPKRPIPSRRTVTFPPTPLRLSRTHSSSTLPKGGRAPHLQLPTPTTPHKPLPRTAAPTKSILKRRAPATTSHSHATSFSPMAQAFRRDSHRVRKSISSKTLAAKQKAQNLKKATGEKINKLMVLAAAEFVGLGCVWQLGKEGLVRSMPAGIEDGFASLASNAGQAGGVDMGAIVGLGLAWTGVVAVGGMLAWNDEKMDVEQ